jgi:hypothetical protein
MPSENCATRSSRASVAMALGEHMMNAPFGDMGDGCLMEGISKKRYRWWPPGAPVGQRFNCVAESLPTFLLTKRRVWAGRPPRKFKSIHAISIIRPGSTRSV